MITFKCKRCFLLLTARDDQIGREIGCSSCGTRATVPEPAMPQFETAVLPPSISTETTAQAKTESDPKEAANPSLVYADPNDLGDQGGTLPQLDDDFYLDDRPYTPEKTSAAGIISIVAASIAGLLEIYIGIRQMRGINPEGGDVAFLVGAMLARLIPALAVGLAVTAIISGLRGFLTQNKGRLLCGIGAGMGFAALLIGFVQFMYLIFPD